MFWQVGRVVAGHAVARAARAEDTRHRPPVGRHQGPPPKRGGDGVRHVAKGATPRHHDVVKVGDEEGGHVPREPGEGGGSEREVGQRKAGQGGCSDEDGQEGGDGCYGQQEEEGGDHGGLWFGGGRHK